MWEEVSEHQKKIAINRHTIKNFIANNSYAQHEQPAYTINVCWTKFVQYNEIGIEIDKSLLKRGKKKLACQMFTSVTENNDKNYRFIKLLLTHTRTHTVIFLFLCE